MTSTVTQSPTDAADLRRRRAILQHHIGDQVALKREVIARQPNFRGITGRLEKVNRVKAVLDFPELGLWDFPITSILLPHSIEPDPRQMDLF